MMVMSMVVGIIDVWSDYLFFQCIFEQKKMKKYRKLLAIICIGSIVILLNHLLVNRYVNVMVSHFSKLVLTVLFVGNFWKKWLVTILCQIISFLNETIIFFAFSSSFSMDLLIEDYNMISNIAIIIKTFLKLFLFYLFSKVYKRQKGIETSKEYFGMSIIPILNFMYIFLLVNRQIKLESVDYFFCYFSLAMLMGTNFLYLWILSWFEKVNKEKIEQTTLLQEYSFRESYYRQLEEHHKEIRKIKHDMKNELIGLLAEYNGNKTKKLDEDLQKIIDRIQVSEKDFFSNNPVVNTILVQKKERMKNYKILFECEIEIPEQINIRGGELGILLGNLLDNAVEAAMQCEKEKWIKLKMYYRNSYLAIECRNSTKRRINDFVTKKKNKESHGFGMKAMLEIVKKFRGNVEFEILENEFNTKISIYGI